MITGESLKLVLIFIPTKCPANFFSIGKGYLIDAGRAIGKSVTIFIVMISLTIGAFADIHIGKGCMSGKRSYHQKPQGQYGQV